MKSSGTLRYDISWLLRLLSLLWPHSCSSFLDSEHDGRKCADTVLPRPRCVRPGCTQRTVCPWKMRTLVVADKVTVNVNSPPPPLVGLACAQMQQVAQALQPSSGKQLSTMGLAPRVIDTKKFVGSRPLTAPDASLAPHRTPPVLPVHPRPLSPLPLAFSGEGRKVGGQLSGSFEITGRRAFIV